MRGLPAPSQDEGAHVGQPQPAEGQRQVEPAPHPAAKRHAEAGHIVSQTPLKGLLHVSPAQHPLPRHAPPAGVQLAVTHEPALQVCPVPQRTPHAPQLAVVVRLASQPSEVAALQSPKPLLHAMPQLDPVQRPVALAAPAQVVVVVVRPSALHTLSVDVEVHDAAPGEQVGVGGRQMPPEHMVVVEQRNSVQAVPLASQARPMVALRHSAAGGVHTNARQVASAAHPCPAGQSTLVRQSTQ